MINHQRFANGVEVVTCPREGANVVSIQCVVWAGSLDERPEERGVAHFLEHMLFKGTKSRGVGKIASSIESAGGDINAYTTFDKTVFYLTLPSSSAELGFDILSDAIFESQLDIDELEKEREVILEEIRRGLDDPGSKIAREIYADLYEGTEAARPIIGESGQIASFTRETLIKFWNTWYQPQNMSVVIVGSITEEDATSLAIKYFGSRRSRNEISRPGSGRHRGLSRVRREKIRTIIVNDEYEQSRLHVVFGGPALDSADCPIIDTATYVMGGSDVARMQTRLKEKEAIVNAIGVSSYSPIFEGICEVSAILDPKNYESACRSIGRELALICQSESVTQQEIERARAATKVAKIHREETVDGVASALVTGLTTSLKHKFEDVYEYLAFNFEASEMELTLRRNWCLDDVLIVVFCKESVSPNPADLEAALKAGVVNAHNEVTKRTSPSPTARKTISHHQFKIGEGMSVIYREIPGSRSFSLTAATEGGLRGETSVNAGIFHAAASMLGLATKNKSYEQFVGRIEDLGTSLSGFSGKDSFGLELQCTAAQAEEMIELFAENMLEPEFPEAQWQALFRETMESLKIQKDSFGWICMRQLHHRVFGNHPYALPVMGFESTVKEFSASGLKAFYENWRDGGCWIIAAAGGAPASLVQDKLSREFSNFKPSTMSRMLSQIHQDDFSEKIFSIKPNRTAEQIQVAIGGKGPVWNSPNRAATDLLLCVLGGQAGRLFSILREDESLAYSVSPLQSQGVAGCLLGAYIATAPDKVHRALKGLENELHKISSSAVSSEELERARAFLLGTHEISLQRTGSQAMTMGLMELYGLGWDDFLRYPERLRQVDLNDVTKVAAQYFERSMLTAVTVGG